MQIIKKAYPDLRVLKKTNPALYEKKRRQYLLLLDCGFSDRNIKQLLSLPKKLSFGKETSKTYYDIKKRIRERLKLKNKKN